MNISPPNFGVGVNQQWWNCKPVTQPLPSGLNYGPVWSGSGELCRAKRTKTGLIRDDDGFTIFEILVQPLGHGLGLTGPVISINMAIPRRCTTFTCANFYLERESARHPVLERR